MFDDIAQKLKMLDSNQDKKQDSDEVVKTTETSQIIDNNVETINQNPPDQSKE